MKAAFAILFVALVSAATASPVASLAQATADNTFLNYMMQPNALTGSSDPAITAECFNKYLPMLSQIADKFSTQYQACITTADQATTVLTDNAASNRTAFVKDTTSICTAFKACDNVTDTLDFFNCYSNASTSDVTEMYTLSNNATMAANTLSQGLQVIKSEQDQCTNDAEHTYVVDTSLTYDELNSCFINGLPDSDTTDAPAVTAAVPAVTAAVPAVTAAVPTV